MAAFPDQNSNSRDAMNLLDFAGNNNSMGLETNAYNMTSMVPGPTDDGDSRALKISLSLIFLATIFGVPILLFALWKRQKRKWKYTEVPTSAVQEKRRSSARKSETKLEGGFYIEDSDPNGHERPITEEEIQIFVDHLTGRHCKRLAEVLGPEMLSKENTVIDEIISETRTKYMNTKQMLTDWLHGQDYSQSEKRSLLHDIVRGLGRGKVQDYTWIEDEELQNIVQALPEHRLKQLCETLSTECEAKAVDSASLLLAVIGWRNGSYSSVLNRIRYKKFLSALRKLEGPRGGDSTEDAVFLEERELRNMALELYMQDLRPFAAALGIDDATIHQYRLQHDEQVNTGTIRLLTILNEREGHSKERVCWTIKEMGYFSLAETFLSDKITGLTEDVITTLGTHFSNAAQKPPEKPDRPITDEEIHAFVEQLTGRHCWRLKEAIGSDAFDKLLRPIKEIINENYEFLFDAKQMILDWLQEQNCRDNVKRQRLNKSVLQIGRTTVEDHSWFGDDELIEVVEHLDETNRGQLRDMLGEDFKCNGSDEKTVIEALREWRNDETPSASGRTRSKRFISTLKSLVIKMDVSSDIPVIEDIDVEELGEIAYHLLMRDVLSFARTIGIEDAKIPLYRKRLLGEKITKGTTYLLKELCNKLENDRQNVSSALKAVGLFKVAQLIHVGSCNAPQLCQ